MFKKVLTFGLLACVLTFTACSDKEEEPPANASATAVATPEPDIAYTQGFFNMEQDNTDTWRWMSEQGTVKLKNTGKEMKLRIAGDVPTDQIKSESTFKITLNGETLEEFTSKIKVNKEYVIPVAKQGSGPASELVVSVNKFFVPKQIDPKSSDERKLSFSLKQLIWEAK